MVGARGSLIYRWRVERSKRKNDGHGGKVTANSTNRAREAEQNAPGLNTKLSENLGLGFEISLLTREQDEGYGRNRGWKQALGKAKTWSVPLHLEARARVLGHPPAFGEFRPGLGTETHDAALSHVLSIACLRYGRDPRQAIACDGQNMPWQAKRGLKSNTIR